MTCSHCVELSLSSECKLRQEILRQKETPAATNRLGGRCCVSKPIYFDTVLRNMRSICSFVEATF